jgi:hypothetical protein
MASGDGHRKANESGLNLENKVEELIKELGMDSIHHSRIGTRFGKKVLTKSPDGFLLKHVPFINMYGEKSHSEFVWQLNNFGPIRIECKQQTVRGSVDEKFPYLLGNCLAFDEKDIVLIMEGEGARESAKRWARLTAKAISHKKVRVFTFPQFRNWAKKMLSGRTNN